MARGFINSGVLGQDIIAEHALLLICSKGYLKLVANGQDNGWVMKLLVEDLFGKQPPVADVNLAGAWPTNGSGVPCDDHSLCIHRERVGSICDATGGVAFLTMPVDNVSARLFDVNFASKRFRKLDTVVVLHRHGTALGDEECDSLARALARSGKLSRVVAEQTPDWEGYHRLEEGQSNFLPSLLKNCSTLKELDAGSIWFDGDQFMDTFLPAVAHSPSKMTKLIIGSALHDDERDGQKVLPLLAHLLRHQSDLEVLEIHDHRTLFFGLSQADADQLDETGVADTLSAGKGRETRSDEMSETGSNGGDSSESGKSPNLSGTGDPDFVSASTTKRKAALMLQNAAVDDLWIKPAIDKGLLDFIDAGSEHPKLRKLVFRESLFCDRGMRAALEIAKHSSSLEELYIIQTPRLSPDAFGDWTDPLGRNAWVTLLPDLHSLRLLHGLKHTLYSAVEEAESSDDEYNSTGEDVGSWDEEKASCIISNLRKNTSICEMPDLPVADPHIAPIKTILRRNFGLRKIKNGHFPSNLLPLLVPGPETSHTGVAKESRVTVLFAAVQCWVGASFPSNESDGSGSQATGTASKMTRKRKVSLRDDSVVPLRKSRVKG